MGTNEGGMCGHLKLYTCCAKAQSTYGGGGPVPSLPAGPWRPHPHREAGEERRDVEGPLPGLQEENGEDADKKSVCGGLCVFGI